MQNKHRPIIDYAKANKALDVELAKLQTERIKLLQSLSKKLDLGAKVGYAIIIAALVALSVGIYLGATPNQGDNKCRNCDKDRKTGEKVRNPEVSVVLPVHAY